MNILQLSKYYPPYRGGLELVAEMISRAHNANGDSISIISFGNSKSKFTGEYGETVNQYKRDLFLNSSPISFKLLFNFRKIITNSKFEVIYIHLPNPFMHFLISIYSTFIKKYNIKLIGVYHSDPVNQKILSVFYNPYFKISGKIYDYFICSSERLWNSSPVLASFANSKKKIIPFCIKNELQYTPRTKFNGNILAIGRLVKYKGFEFLVKTINKTNYNLKIIGDGPLYRKLEGISNDNIEICGELSEHEKQRLIQESDLLVVSSINRSEAYGMIIVEAFQNGLPVVASDIFSGVTYLVQDSKTGKTFRYGNQQELLDAITYFKDPKNIQTISENCRNFYEQNLKFDRFCHNINNLYSKLP